MINHGHITWGTSPKTRFRAHLDLCGPPEASRGQTGQTSVGIKVEKGKLEQFGSVFWYLEVVKALQAAIQLIKNNKNPKIQKKTFFFVFLFVLLHRVPSATGTMNILYCRRGAPQVHCAAGARRCSRAGPGRNQLVARAKRGSRPLTRRGKWQVFL